MDPAGRPDTLRTSVATIGAEDDIAHDEDLRRRDGAPFGGGGQCRAAESGRLDHAIVADDGDAGSVRGPLELFGRTQSPALIVNQAGLEREPVPQPHRNPGAIDRDATGNYFDDPGNRLEAARSQGYGGGPQGAASELGTSKVQGQD